MVRFGSALALLWLATLATAQELPAPITSYVNDYIDLLPEAEEAALTRQLSDLKRDHDIEMTVVLMSSKSAYASTEPLETFSTRLFNTWGIGDASRNDGILLLVLKDDRETRIELGKSYGAQWDGTAARILDRNVLPYFMNDNYARGLSDGTKEIIDTLALAHAEGQPAPKSSPRGPINWLLGALAIVPIGIILFGRRLRDGVTSRSRCPSCGARTLEVSRSTNRTATKAHKGEKERRIHCTNCGYDDRQVWSTSKSSSSSGRSFGGGSSGGGGASGRW